MIKVVEKKKIWFSISLTVILVGLVLLFTRGLNFGIDFKGGTKLQVELGEKLDTAALDEIINKYDSSASCKIVNDTQYEIKSTVLDETTSSELLNEIEETFELETDYFIPLFGLSPKLGPIANWGLEIEKNAIKVNNALDYQTNIEGIYAIGDVNTYPGKLKLILCAVKL